MGTGDKTALIEQITGSAYRNRMRIFHYEDLLKLVWLKEDLQKSLSEEESGAKARSILLPLESVDVGIFISLIMEIASIRAEPPSKLEPEPEPVTPTHEAIISQQEYENPLLESLVELGGKRKKSGILSKVHDKMKNKLTSADYERTPSGGDIRWRNHVAWARYKLKQQAYNRPNSPVGVWEIIDEGRKYSYRTIGKRP